MIKFFLVFLIFNSINLCAEDKLDTLKHYKLGEIIATSKKNVKTIHKSTTTVKSYFEIQSQDVNSVSEFINKIPSANVITNSRGESLVYLRGAGERQMGVFFDGAYFNIPWDNRLDMSLIPTDIIGQLKVENATSSVLKGANILGGIVDISTVSLDNDGYHGIINIQAADGGQKKISLTQDGKNGAFSYILNYSFFGSDGQILPNLEKNINYQNNNSKLRTNTDINRNSFFGRAVYELEDTQIGLSLSKIVSDKGVAPESNKSINKARFWRYKDWNRTFINFNLNHKFNDDVNIKTSFWYDNFGQEILSFADSTDYKINDNTQLDSDDSYGGRILLNYLPSEDGIFNFVLNYSGTKHDQIIEKNLINDELLEYSQNILSFATSYEHIFGDLVTEVGVGYDYLNTPKTGIFTESEGNSTKDYSFQINANYNINEKFNIFLANARKTRFPTLREHYDDALGKFKVNPELKAETGILTELGIDYSTQNLKLVATYFNSIYTDLIESIDLEDGTRQRVNLSEALINGIELKFDYKPFNKMNINGFVTYLDANGILNGKSKQLDQKPNILSNITFLYKLPYQIIPSVEFEFTGNQYDKNQKLEPTTLINMRLAYSLIAVFDIYSTFYVRANNITDQEKYSQLGLPEAGRTFMVGIKSNFDLGG